jgi:hypothetical protein
MYGTMRKSSISTRLYAEIHIQRPFFDNKNSIWKIIGLKIQMAETCSSASSTCRNFYFWKTLKSQFLVVFQSFSFGKIWADLGRFGQILLHRQWLTACPNFSWNLKNLITFELYVQTLRVTAHWKAINTLHLCFKSQVHQRILAIAAACPKPFCPPPVFRG